MRFIPLSKGKFAAVDDGDYDRVSQYPWFAFKVHNSWYAATGSVVKNKRTYLHRFVTNAPAGMEVDHVNGHGLDNRKANLRICRHRDNLRNQRRIKPSRSGYRGVTLTPHGKFVARCKYHGKMLYWGTYSTAEEAARVRDRKVMELHGEFAYLNFPREEYEKDIA